MAERTHEIVSARCFEEAMHVLGGRIRELPFTRNEAGKFLIAHAFNAEHEFSRRIEASIIDGVTGATLIACLFPVPPGMRASRYVADCHERLAGALNKVIK